MKEILKQEGIVIHSEKYKDSGALIAILEKSGLNLYQVRGAFKPGSGTLKFTQLMTKLSFNYANGKLRTLTDAYIEDNYSDLKLDLDKYNYISIIMEKIYNFYQAITEKEIIYDFFMDIVELMKKSNYYKELTLIFEVKLLYLLGVTPGFNNCMACGKKVDLTKSIFNIIQGGVIGEECKRRYFANLNSEETLILKKIYVTKLKDLNEDILKEFSNYPKINSVIDEYYMYHLEFNSQVKRIMKEINV